MPLKRSLTLPLVTFYGLGTIIGAGIYALIGTVIKHASFYTPLAFLTAAIIALFTAASYAELSSRFPQSAGSALYVNKAFNRAWFSGITGWAIVATGVISAATLTHGFFNYLQIFYTAPEFIIIPLLIVILGGIALLGITESATSIMIMTLIEILGLLIIIWYGKNSLSQIVIHWDRYIPDLHASEWSGILTGSFLAFYAFIGFEDMVNIAEETKQPERIIPLGIFLALLGATLLYLLVSIVTVTELPHQEFAKSEVPLTLIIQQQGHSPIFFGLIALLAIANGILVQIIMASRMVFGMAKFKSSPKIFANISKKTKVPYLATLLIMGCIIILAYGFPLETLAKATSSVMLVVFCFMHLSLIIIKFKHSKPKDIFSIPLFVPIIGLLLSLSFLFLPLIMK